MCKDLNLDGEMPNTFGRTPSPTHLRHGLQYRSATPSQSRLREFPYIPWVTKLLIKLQNLLLTEQS